MAALHWEDKDFLHNPFSTPSKPLSPPSHCRHSPNPSRTFLGTFSISSRHSLIIGTLFLWHPNSPSQHFRHHLHLSRHPLTLSTFLSFPTHVQPSWPLQTHSRHHPTPLNTLSLSTPSKSLSTPSHFRYPLIVDNLLNTPTFVIRHLLSTTFLDNHSHSTPSYPSQCMSNPLESLNTPLFTPS